MLSVTLHATHTRTHTTNYRRAARAAVKPPSCAHVPPPVPSVHLSAASAHPLVPVVRQVPAPAHSPRPRFGIAAPPGGCTFSPLARGRLSLRRVRIPLRDALLFLPGRCVALGVTFLYPGYTAHRAPSTDRDHAPVATSTTSPSSLDCASPSHGTSPQQLTAVGPTSRRAWCLCRDVAARQSHACFDDALPCVREIRGSFFFHPSHHT